MSKRTEASTVLEEHDDGVEFVEFEVQFAGFCDQCCFPERECICHQRGDD